MKIYGVFFFLLLSFFSIVIIVAKVDRFHPRIDQATLNLKMIVQHKNLVQKRTAQSSMRYISSYLRSSRIRRIVQPGLSASAKLSRKSYGFLFESNKIGYSSDMYNELLKFTNIRKFYSEKSIKVEPSTFKSLDSGRRSLSYRGLQKHYFSHHSFTRRYAKSRHLENSDIVNVEDTIFALSSGKGKAGVSVIRISGPQAKEILQILLKEGTKFPEARTASLRKIYHPYTRDLLDMSLVLWFPAPRSFTGEDTVEIQCHGSNAVVSGITNALLSLSESFRVIEEIKDNDCKMDDKERRQGDIIEKEELKTKEEKFQVPFDNYYRIRLAERGEFTKRAFERGHMDLTEVEGLADLIAADTSEQRRQALRQMEGGLKFVYEGWKKQIIKCLAHTEAVIDFSDDEEDVGGDSTFSSLFPILKDLRQSIQKHLQDSGQRGEIIRNGLKVTIIGAPNAGKSSLLNKLAQRPAAIVSPIAGTTRDIVEIQLDIAGYPVILSDTAGLREIWDENNDETHSPFATKDIIEQEGIVRAKEAAKNAHVTIFTVDASDMIHGLASLPLKATSRCKEKKILDKQNLENLLKVAAKEIHSSHGILIINKVDLLKDQENNSKLLLEMMESTDFQDEIKPIWISCNSGEGIDSLIQKLQKCMDNILNNKDNNDGTSNTNEDLAIITRERHRYHLTNALLALNNILENKIPQDLAAEELRIAAREIGAIMGHTDVEQILDVIFQDFCIGK